MALRASSLGPKPFFVWFVFLFPFFVLEGLRVRWAGPKGHLLTWPQTLPICFVCFLFFLFSNFCFRKMFQSCCFPLKKGHFCWLFSVPLCFHSSFSRYLSLSLYISISLSLSLSLSLAHFSFFLSLFFVSLFCPVSLLWFHEKNKLKLSYWKVFSSILSVVFISWLVLSFKSPFHILFILSCVFLFNKVIKSFFLQKRQLIKHQILVKLGVARKRLFLS